MTHNVYDPDGNYTTVTKEAPALLQFDNLNRLVNMVLLNQADIDMQPAATTNTPQQYSGSELTYGGVFNSVAYQNDVNKYEFEKASYDYQIEQINQQTKQIQQQDKSLELKMKQLDTEHNAIQTEIEAVQKVIQKNVEGSFKTFA
jgi:chromosome segregation ATPase